MKEHRNSMVLYTTAVCNLNCRYCFIDKNPALQQIDDLLDKSFKDENYYFDFAKEMFERDKLRTIQFWGGEPTLNLMRVCPTIRKCIEYFPNATEFLMSTNLVGHNFFEQYFGFLKMLGEYPNKQFNFSLQLSLDGPTWINDINRGKGVTEQFTKNYKILLEKLQSDLPSNVICAMHFKPTLDSSSIANLQTKDAIIEYFKFFETFYQTFEDINRNKNVSMAHVIPNTACPSPHTKEDGKLFANYCKLAYEIECENLKNPIFKFYKNGIRSFRPREPVCNLPMSLARNCMGHCGSGRSVIGLLPNKMISCCHNGFVDLLADYKKHVLAGESTHMGDVTIEKALFTNQKNALIFAYGSKEFEDYEKKVEVFYCEKSPLKISNLASLIILLALTDQIDSKYANKEEAIRGAQFIYTATSYCVRDNIGTTGSLYLMPLGLIKLLLNGAREYIELEVQR